MSYFAGAADLHVHTSWSDGHSSVAEIVDLLAAMPQRLIVAITDHDTIEGAREACELGQRHRLEIIIGEEISTAEGHLLGLFLEQRIAPGASMAASIRAVHAQGGVAVVAHPYDWLTDSAGELVRSRAVIAGGDWALDGVETFNAALPLAGMNRRAAALARTLALCPVAGSDAHHAAMIGRGCTRFHGSTAQQLKQALLRGTTVADGRPWGWRGTAQYLANSARRAVWRREPLAS
jgi:predicted metal-dependent phosphoesterase TrpH